MSKFFSQLFFKVWHFGKRCCSCFLLMCIYRSVYCQWQRIYNLFGCFVWIQAISYKVYFAKFKRCWGEQNSCKRCSIFDQVDSPEPRYNYLMPREKICCLRCGDNGLTMLYIEFEGCTLVIGFRPTWRTFQPKLEN